MRSPRGPGSAVGGLGSALGTSQVVSEDLPCALGVLWEARGALGEALGESWGSLGELWGDSWGVLWRDRRDLAKISKNPMIVYGNCRITSPGEAANLEKNGFLLKPRRRRVKLVACWHLPGTGCV